MYMYIYIGIEPWSGGPGSLPVLFQVALARYGGFFFCLSVRLLAEPTAGLVQYSGAIFLTYG